MLWSFKVNSGAIWPVATDMDSSFGVWSGELLDLNSVRKSSRRPYDSGSLGAWQSRATGAPCEDERERTPPDRGPLPGSGRALRHGRAARFVRPWRGGDLAPVQRVRRGLPDQPLF